MRPWIEGEATCLSLLLKLDLCRKHQAWTTRLSRAICTLRIEDNHSRQRTRILDLGSKKQGCFECHHGLGWGSEDKNKVPTILAITGPKAVMAALTRSCDSAPEIYSGVGEIGYVCKWPRGGSECHRCKGNWVLWLDSGQIVSTEQLTVNNAIFHASSPLILDLLSVCLSTCCMPGTAHTLSAWISQPLWVVENLCVAIWLRRKPGPWSSAVPCRRPVSQEVAPGTWGHGMWKAPYPPTPAPASPVRRKAPWFLFCFVFFSHKNYFLVEFVRLEKHRTQSWHSTRGLSSTEKKRALAVLRKDNLLFSLMLVSFWKTFLDIYIGYKNS